MGGRSPVCVTGSKEEKDHWKEVLRECVEEHLLCRSGVFRGASSRLGPYSRHHARAD